MIWIKIFYIIACLIIMVAIWNCVEKDDMNDKP
jgi:hypothetical protein